MNADDIRSPESEAGVVASILVKPDLTFYSENLKPNHFIDPQNAYLYYAVCEIAKRGIDKVDAYNISQILSANKYIRDLPELKTELSVQALNDVIETAHLIARSSVEDYKVLVDNVMDAAFRRNTFRRLQDCGRLCFSSTDIDIEHQIYQALDDVLMEFSATNEIPQYKDMIDEYWKEIEERQLPDGGGAIPFHINALNSYVKIEPGELVIFGAEQKQGKSMLLMNIAVDLLRRGKKVLYLDSELSSRLFTCRLISHLTSIEFRSVRDGRYDADGKKRIDEAREWMKSRSFTHLYMPLFDIETIYSAVKKVYHTQGIDVLIVDYFKGNGNGKDAYANYNELGKLVDFVKNTLCGDMKIAGVGAAQATRNGYLADSAKIARNASTIIMLHNKSEDEIARDGVECGNKKMCVKFNRNGAQHTDDEYIDLFFHGDICTYSEAKQHVPETPY